LLILNKQADAERYVISVCEGSAEQIDFAHGSKNSLRKNQ